MKRILLTILICVASVSLVGCGSHIRAAKAHAQEVSGAFASNDMSTINKTILGTNEQGIEDKLSDMWEPFGQTDEGILTYIFENVVLTVADVTKETITYDIEAPDMSHIIADLKADSSIMTEEDLLQYVRAYAENADTVKATVSVDYSFSNGELIVNYQNEPFINAITGGFLNAYISFYTEMMDAYAEEVG